MAMKHDSAHAAAASKLSPSSAEGIWFVQTRSGIQTWTLDDLDLAFQRGDIDAETPVFTSGMDDWETLGVIAELDAPPVNHTAANDTAMSATVVNASAEPSPDTPRHTPPPRHLQPPPLHGAPVHAGSAPRAVAGPPPLGGAARPADGGTFPPTSTAVFGNGASVWSTIATAEQELQTGVRRNATMVPFVVRRRLGRVFDFASTFMLNLRASHPRCALVGPWLFGAALSGVFIFALYRVANAPPSPGMHTRSGPKLAVVAASTSAASTSAASAAAGNASAVNAGVSSPSAASRVATTPAVEPEPLGTTRAAVASLSDEDGADDSPRPGTTGVLRTRDLQFAPGRSERQLASSGRAKAKGKAWSKRSKARARKARRSRSRAVEE
jgi:hypothetical protein